jgi:hypothetical protein
VTWTTTTDVDTFLAEAEPFLLADPVATNVLVTESSFWAWLPHPAPGARFGWWAEAGGTHGAFVETPGHAPVCSPLSAEAAAGLAAELVGATRLAVDARDADVVTAAWRARGRVLRPSARLALLRLDSLRTPALPEGTARVADAGDVPLLRSWFSLFRERHPGDPSQVEFVVDHPIEEGCVVVWEVEGRPVAMASRTPEVAGTTRVGLAFQPAPGTAYAEAAFVSGCAEASRTADHVLVLGGTASTIAGYRSYGFAHVRDRVVLRLHDPPAT